MNRKFNIIFILISVSLLAILFIVVNQFGLLKVKYDRALAFTSKSIQTDMIENLKNHNVPYKADEEGFIYYPSEHESLVESILQTVEKKHTKPHVIFSDDEIKGYFTNLLDEARIPFRIRKLDVTGKESIEWDWIYNDEAHKLYRKAIRIATGHSQNPNIFFQDSEKKNIFLTVLEKEGIPYQLKKLNGIGEYYIEWAWKHDEKVQKIITEVRERKTEIAKERCRIVFQNPEQKTYFLDLLKEDNIPYKLGEIEVPGLDIADSEFIEWNCEHDDKVQLLIKKVKRAN
ncbi:MAG TPA: hypothetical protein ENH40_04380 [Nitrospirae bacterium]|nr:hypothetical protein [Nitrospirota bacterium]